MESHKFVLVGVGGQGTLLASNLLAEVGFLLGLDVKKAEIHGMSQRGGSVVSNVVWGQPVFSPVIGDAEADSLIAFEKLEALRYLRLLKTGGTAFVNDYKIEPITVSAGKQSYPEHSNIVEAIKKQTTFAFLIPASTIAQELGNSRIANTVMIGGVVRGLGIDFDIGIKALEKIIQSQYLELNLRAFQAGYEWIKVSIP